MPHAEFLKLLQMTEAGRKCEGRECLDILDGDVAKALVLDEIERAHQGEVGQIGHDDLSCAECAKVAGSRVELRESLHTRGVDFPVDVLASR